MLAKYTDRRHAVRGLAAAALLLCALPLWAQGQPLKILIGFPPGGSADTTARVLADKMKDTLGVPVLVENRPGAGSTIGSGEVAKAPADGYTLLLASQTNAISASLYPKLPFNPIEDFVGISLLGREPGVLVVHPSMPARSFEEFIAYAKANPDKLSFGSPGIGTSVHVSGELFKSLTGTQMQHVPYKGRQFAIPDLVGGQIQVMFDNMPSALPPRPWTSTRAYVARSSGVPATSGASPA